MKRINFVFMFVVVLIGLIISTINIKVSADAGERDIILEVDVNNPMTLAEIIENAQIEAHSASIDYTDQIVCIYSDGYFTDVLNQAAAADANRFYNPGKVDMFFALEVINYYTNISKN